jgi:hypothetical protein
MMCPTDARSCLPTHVGQEDGGGSRGQSNYPVMTTRTTRPAPARPLLPTRYCLPACTLRSCTPCIWAISEPAGGGGGGGAPAPDAAEVSAPLEELARRRVSALAPAPLEISCRKARGGRLAAASPGTGAGACGAP